MDLNGTNDSKWRSTDSHSDIGQDESMTEPINDAFHLLDEKHSDDFTTETMCDNQNGNEDNRIVAAEEGLLNAMNNLQIASAKKLKLVRDPMMQRENFTGDNDKKTDGNEPSETQNLLIEAIGPKINDMNREAMKLLDPQSSKKITSIISKSRDKIPITHSNCKHLVETISNAGDGVHVKEETIKFFGIPVTATRTKRTQVIPFNFQNRTMKKQELQDRTGKSMILSKSFCSSNMSVGGTKTLAKSSKNDTVIGNVSKVSNNSTIESQKMKTLGEVGQSNFPNLSYKNITIRKIIAKSSENITKMNKENNMLNNNIIKSQEIKPKVHAIGPKLHTDKRAKDRQKFDEKIKQRTLEIEEMRARVEQKKREKMKHEEIALRKKLESKAKPMPVYKIPGSIRSTKPLTEPQSPAWSMKPKRLQ